MTAHQVRSYGPRVSTNNRPARLISPPDGDHAVPVYEIRVAGRLTSRWSAWFDGMAITTEDDGSTVIRGPVVDQAALHGLIQKLRDVGIPLLALTQVPAAEPTEPLTHPSKEN